MTHADIDWLRGYIESTLTTMGATSAYRASTLLSELIRLAHVGLDAEPRPTPPTYFGLPVTYREGNPDPGPF